MVSFVAHKYSSILVFITRYPRESGSRKYHTLIATLFAYHKQKIGMIFTSNSFQDMTSNMKNHFCNFSVGWLSVHTQSNYEKMSNSSWVEVYVWSHNYKTISSNESTFLASGSLKLWYLNYLNITNIFKTQFIGGHTIHWGLLFPGHAVCCIATEFHFMTNKPPHVAGILSFKRTSPRIYLGTSYQNLVLYAIVIYKWYRPWKEIKVHASYTNVKSLRQCSTNGLDTRSRTFQWGLIYGYWKGLRWRVGQWRQGGILFVLDYRNMSNLQLQINSSIIFLTNLLVTPCSVPLYLTPWITNLDQVDLLTSDRYLQSTYREVALLSDTILNVWKDATCLCVW